MQAAVAAGVGEAGPALVEQLATVMAVTPEQLAELPAEQRQQILQLQALAMQFGVTRG